MRAARLTVHGLERRVVALVLLVAAMGTAAVLTLGPRAAAAAVPASATAPGVAGVSMGAGGETWFETLSASEQHLWIETMVADGIKWVRIDSPGNLDGWYNTEIQDAEAAGINVDAGIETWGMSSVTPATMGPMCTGQVQQLEPLGVQTYEVINEPNADGGPNEMAATAYEPLLAACYTAIKAADPDATVLMGSLAESGGSNAAATYLAAVYAAGGEPYFDEVGMHPSVWTTNLPSDDQQYATSPADCPNNAWNPWENCSDTSANVAGGQQSEISAVRTVMDENGDSSKAIWMTEFGCPTGTDGGYTAVCSDAQLATQITDAYQQLHANPGDEYGLVGPMFVYDFIDTNSSDDPEGSGYDDFGLYADNGVAKPGVLSAFEAGAALAGAAPAGPAPAGPAPAGAASVSAPSWSSGNPSSVTAGSTFKVHFSLGGASSGTIYGLCPDSSWGSVTVTGSSYTDGGCSSPGTIELYLTNSAGTSSTLDVTNSAGTSSTLDSGNSAGSSSSGVSTPSWSSGNPTSVTPGSGFKVHFSGDASSGTIYVLCPDSSWGSVTVTGSSYTDGGCSSPGTIEFYLTNSAGTSSTLDVASEWPCCWSAPRAAALLKGR